MEYRVMALVPPSYVVITRLSRVDRSFPPLDRSPIGLPSIKTSVRLGCWHAPARLLVARLAAGASAMKVLEMVDMVNLRSSVGNGG